MRRFILIPILILAASCLTLGQTSAARTKTEGNPFIGTWKANLSKSKQHPNHRFESATLHFEVSNDIVLLTYAGVNAAGEQESGTTKLHPDGKEHTIAEARGVVEVTKWVGSHTLETVAKKDGKVVGQSRYEVSNDGKTLTAKVKGIDASGAEFGQVIVFDRE
jgi:hypothetical protein